MNTPLRLAATAAALSAAGAVLAQSRQIPAPPQQRPIVITGATVHTVTGPAIADGYVVFDNGRITAIDSGRPPDLAGARVVDASGRHVYPGLISCDTTLGLVETRSVSATTDFSEYGAVSPEVRAAVAVNPDSELIPVTRANGILTAMLTPRGGLVSGRSSIIRLDGWTWEQMTIEPDAGLVVQWPRTELAPTPRRTETKSEKEQRTEIRENLEAIEKLFDDAAAYLANREADGRQPIDLRYEAMRDVIRGDKPVFVRADSQGQIESAIAWADRRGLSIVIVGGSEANRAAGLLHAHDVPVIVGGLHRLPGHRDDPYDDRFTLPAKLHAAGVRFAIASGTMAAHERQLNHNAATAAAYGLPREQALAAVTIEAARILGIGASHGSLEVGKSATLIVTDGDPLQITTNVLAAFIDGRPVDLGNRHRALYEKYKQKYRQLGLLDE